MIGRRSTPPNIESRLLRGWVLEKRGMVSNICRRCHVNDGCTRFYGPKQVVSAAFPSFLFMCCWWWRLKGRGCTWVNLNFAPSSHFCDINNQNCLLLTVLTYVCTNLESIKSTVYCVFVYWFVGLNSCLVLTWSCVIWTQFWNVCWDANSVRFITNSAEAESTGNIQLHFLALVHFVANK